MKNFLAISAIAAASIGALALLSLAQAAGMSSAHYEIQSDSVNFGGDRSTSSSYVMEDTVGEIATGVSSSTHYVANAGYQQMQVTYFSVTAPSDVVMSPAIGGVSGGTADGQTSFTVTTDDPTGYYATIQASSSPALRSSTDSFADYAPAGAAPDFAFSIPAASSSFGFSPEGADIAARYKDNGAGTCGIGSNDTAGACWDGLSTSPRTFASRAAGNQPGGTLLTLRFRAASGSAHVQTSGAYVATTTVTILPL